MLTQAQQTIHDRYTAIGFTIFNKPFARTDRTTWYFMSRPDSDERRTDFSVNLDSGICHQMGTHQLRTIDQAEAEYSGERQGVSPPSAIQTAQVPVSRPATRKPESRQTEKKKQAALF